MPADITTLVVVESPYGSPDAATVEANKEYLRRCIRSCISLGESPYASHRMLTDALDDNDSVEREQGIQAGFLWRHVAEKTVVYLDRGVSRGMVYGIQDALRRNRPIELRCFNAAGLTVETKLRLEVLGLPITEVPSP